MSTYIPTGNNRPVIMTSVPGRISPTWSKNTVVVEGVKDSESTDPHLKSNSRFGSIKVAWKLFRRRKDVDCYVTSGSLEGFVLAILQTVFPFGKKPHLIMAAIWTYARNPLEHFIRRIILSFLYKSVNNTFVNVSREIDVYSNYFWIPRNKITFLPYCYRLTGYKYDVKDLGYIWSGGNGDRDYNTLIEAVRGISVPVVINATRMSLFNGIDLPTNVTVQGVTPDEFRASMAGCSFGVIPMEGGKLHSGGQQTFLALMKMGKPVILTDPEGGKDYIYNAYNGFLTPFGDVNALNKAINFLVNHPELIIEMGNNALESVSNNSEDDYLSAILTHAYDEVKQYNSHKH